MVGILCGATTNTPALGAAQQTLKQMGIESSTPALGCAVAYPMGVIGVILAVLLIRKFLVHKEDLEIKEKDDANKTFIAENGSNFVEEEYFEALMTFLQKEGEAKFIAESSSSSTLSNYKFSLTDTSYLKEALSKI